MPMTGIPFATNKVTVWIAGNTTLTDAGQQVLAIEERVHFQGDKQDGNSTAMHIKISAELAA